MAYKNIDNVLKKVSDDEPIFVLRGQDATAPLIVIDWVRANFLHAPEDKLREAFEHALVMRNYHTKKIPD